MFISCILFILLYLYISNRHAVTYALQMIKGQKLLKEKSTDKKILEIINKKAGLHLKYFFLYDGGNAWGFMAGIPGYPQLFLRRDIYKGNFSRDELQWLLLHEAGHYKLWHTTREFFHQLISIIFGIWILSLVSSIYLQLLSAIVLAIILGIYAVRVGKMCEYEAEKYALSKLDNPKGMIQSGKRSIAEWRKAKRSENNLFYKLFDRWEISMYRQRIKMTQDYLNSVKKK